MKNKIYKSLTNICIYETIFLLVFLFLLKSFYHGNIAPIYYINIIIYSLISISSWINLKYSKINKEILAFIGIWTTIMTIFSVIFIFQDNFGLLFNFYNYNLLNLFSTGFRLLFTSYLFLFSLNPISNKGKILLGAFSITIGVMSVTFLPIFISGEYRYSYDPLYSSIYYTHIFNLSMLLIIWHQYAKSKFIFSEYISNILSVWTIIIGLEIFHYFSSQNELLFHYLAQYFYAVLYLVIVVLLILRTVYLHNPKSKENEEYIKNYYLLKDVVSKPRRGVFIDFYSSFTKTNLVVSFSILFLLGIYLYFFDKFTVFLRLSVLVLVIAILISLLLSIITMYKRWYDAVGVLFKKHR